MKWAAAHPGQDRRLPSVVTNSRLQRATSVRSRVGIVLEDGSGVAIDWVTGRSYSSARRRLNIQSSQRKGRKGAAAPYPSVAVRDRGHWKGVSGSGWARWKVTPQRVCFEWKGVGPRVRLESRSGRAGGEPEEHKCTKIRTSLTWPNHVLHHTSKWSGKDSKIRCIGSIYSLLNGKDWSSIKQDRTQSSFTTHSQLIVSRRLSWWKLEKSYTRKYMRHLDLLRRFPLKTIGWMNWVQKSLEAARTPNESNQKSKTQLSRTGRPVGEQQITQEIEKDVLFGREGSSTQQERWDPWMDQNPSRVACQCLLNL